MSDTKTTLTVISLLIGLVYLPFSFYLTYLMLQKIGGTDLMWFIFWLLIPLAFLVSILGKLVENIGD